MSRDFWSAFREFVAWTPDGTRGILDPELVNAIDAAPKTHVNEPAPQLGELSWTETQNAHGFHVLWPPRVNAWGDPLGVR